MLVNSTKLTRVESILPFFFRGEGYCAERMALWYKYDAGRYALRAKCLAEFEALWNKHNAALRALHVKYQTAHSAGGWIQC